MLFAPARINQRITRYGALLFFIAAAFALCFPLLKDLHTSCRGDWDYCAFIYESPAISLFEYGQFPLWNPYDGGGTPFIGHPNAGFPSPIFICTAIFGVFAGLKIAVWLHTFLGLWGMWLLGGRLGLSGPGRALPPVVFMFSSCWALRITEGHITWLPAAFLPLLLLSFLKSRDDKRWIFAAGCIESVMFYEGATYIFAFSLLFFTAYALFISVEEKILAPLKSLFWIQVITLGLSAPRLLPMLQILGGTPRPTAAGTAHSWDDLLAFLLERNGPPLPWGEWETGSYIGAAMLALYLLGLLLIRKRSLIFCSVLMLLVCVGNFGPLSPWAILHKLPLFNSFQVPTRAFIFFVFLAALVAGTLLSELQKSSDVRVQAFLWLVVIAIAGDFFLLSYSILGEAAKTRSMTVIHDDFKVARIDCRLYHVGIGESAGLFSSVPSLHKPFQHVAVPDRQRLVHGAWSDQYLPLLQNHGVVDAYEAFPIDCKAQPVTSRDYRGEHYLKGMSGSATLTFWSPNLLRFHLLLPQSETLTINQNFNKGWKSSKGEVVNSDGLLAVNLPKGDYDVELRYLPTSFLVGVAIFVVTLFGMILTWRRVTR